MFRFFTSDGSKSHEAADIEKYRTRHRQLCRSQRPDATRSTHVGDLDVEDGRTRKIPVKWRQQQEQEPQIPVSNQLNAEVHMGSNAFDFSTSPEAFYETEPQQQMESEAPSCQDNQQSEEETRERNASGSLWERRFLDRPTSESTRQLPTLGQDALWGSPMHYVTQDAQRQALYFQPQYYA